MNPPRSWHTFLNGDLFLVLAPVARLAELRASGDGTGVFADTETDWRVPDQVHVRPDQVIDEGPKLRIDRAGGSAEA